MAHPAVRPARDQAADVGQDAEAAAEHEHRADGEGEAGDQEHVRREHGHPAVGAGAEQPYGDHRDLRGEGHDRSERRAVAPKRRGPDVDQHDEEAPERRRERVEDRGARAGDAAAAITETVAMVVKRSVGIRREPTTVSRSETRAIGVAATSVISPSSAPGRVYMSVSAVASTPCGSSRSSHSDTVTPRNTRPGASSASGRRTNSRSCARGCGTTSRASSRTSPHARSGRGRACAAPSARRARGRLRLDREQLVQQPIGGERRATRATAFRKSGWSAGPTGRLR